MFATIVDFVFDSDKKQNSPSQKDIQLMADDASETVIKHARQNTSIGDMQAIRQYRRETAASLSIALRVIKELKWRENFASYREQLSSRS